MATAEAAIKPSASALAFRLVVKADAGVVAAQAESSAFLQAQERVN
jgi:hypothetical protein